MKYESFEPFIALYKLQMKKVLYVPQSRTKSCEKQGFRSLSKLSTKPHFNFNIVYGRPKFSTAQMVHRALLYANSAWGKCSMGTSCSSVNRLMIAMS